MVSFLSAPGIHSPMSGIGSGGGSGGSTSTFSSSSLNALQAISEGVGSSLPSTLTSPSPAHKPGSSPSIHSSSTSQPSQQAKPGQDGSKSPAGSLGPVSSDHHLPTHHHHHHQHAQAESSDRPDSQAATTGLKEPGEGSSEAGVGNSESQRRVPDSKGHKKLLQLLTSPTEELGLSGSGSTGLPLPPPSNNSTPVGADSKDTSGGMTSPSSTGVSSSSSASASAGQTTGQSSTSASISSAHYTGSLQEKHKILHKLLQNGNTPDEVAKITAEATGKVSLGGQDTGEAGTGASGNGSGSGLMSDTKQEQHSPKKEKTHALLHYLLNKDDSKEPVDVKPKLEELEGKAPPGAAGGPPSEHSENKIKSEPPDDVRLCHNI